MKLLSLKCMILFFFISGCFILTATDHKFITDFENDGSVLLPAEKIKSGFDLTVNQDFVSKEWKDFKRNNPKWNLIFDQLTGQAHRAAGNPIQIEGFLTVDELNIKESAIAFIDQNKSLFGFSSSDLKLRRTTKVNDLWSVSFSQVYKGIEVLLTEVELRIRPDGKVMAFGINYYDDINIDVSSMKSHNELMKSAYLGLDFDIKKDVTQSTGDKYILPVRFGKSISFHPVEKFIIEMASNNGYFSSFVNIQTGELVWRRNLVIGIETPIEVTGLAREFSRFDNLDELAFKNFKFTAGTKSFTTDGFGKQNIDIDKPTFISAGLEGLWAKVHYLDKNIASIKDSIYPGIPFKMLWDDLNSHLFERNLYIYANNAHDYYKMIDPFSDVMDYQMLVTISNQNTPNAGSNLETGDISYSGANTFDYYYPECPSILYHEYGHSINTRLYKYLGLSEGMVNKSCHEGTADINAALMTDNPKIGYLSRGDTTEMIRIVLNTNKYPDDVSYDSHITGLILSGAYWDLRLVTNLDYVRHLVHYTKKIGTPDDPDNGTAFYEWFFESLIADDSFNGGDNDLSNGSPNMIAIIESFNKHNIGTSLVTQMSFNHIPFSNTMDTLNEYKIEFRLSNPLNFLDNKPENVELTFSTDDFNTKTVIPAIETSDGNYSANIPPQKSGSIVQYYISATDKFSDIDLFFTLNNANFTPYHFFVGYEVGMKEDFSNAVGWKFGGYADNTSRGAWEIAIPKPVVLDYGGSQTIIQPGTDPSGNQSKCLVTGANNTGSGYMYLFNYMPNGRTTVTSPTYDISKAKNPILSYQKFFFNVLIASGGEIANWKTSFSSDNGYSWIEVENDNIAVMNWEFRYYFIEEYVKLSNRFKVKFEFEAFNNQLFTVFNEGLIDDFEILTTNQNENPMITEVNEIENKSNLTIYPNPGFEQVIISTGNINSDKVRIEIFDLLGNEIINSDHGLINAGNGNYIWDCSDVNKKSVNSGIYIVKTIIDNIISTNKLILN